MLHHCYESINLIFCHPDLSFSEPMTCISFQVSLNVLQMCHCHTTFKAQQAILRITESVSKHLMGDPIRSLEWNLLHNMYWCIARSCLQIDECTFESFVIFRGPRQFLCYYTKIHVYSVIFNCHIMVIFIFWPLYRAYIVEFLFLSSVVTRSGWHHGRLALTT